MKNSINWKNAPSNFYLKAGSISFLDISEGPLRWQREAINNQLGGEGGKGGSREMGLYVYV